MRRGLTGEGVLPMNFYNSKAWRYDLEASCAFYDINLTRSVMRLDILSKITHRNVAIPDIGQKLVNSSKLIKNILRQMQRESEK